MKTEGKVLWWSVLAAALVLLTVILPRLAPTRVGSWTNTDVKLARCTNSSLKILIRQMPENRKINLVLGAPEKLTNAIQQVSGLISASHGLTVTGATNIAFALTARNHATWPNIIRNSEEPLIAYFLCRIEGTPSRFMPAKSR
jgi:hypothetical protein